MFETSFDVARFLNPLIMVVSCIAIPVIVLHGSRHHIERWLGLEFGDLDYETRYRPPQLCGTLDLQTKALRCTATAWKSHSVAQCALRSS